MKFLFVIILLMPLNVIIAWDRPIFKIVIDPGHGGNNQKPFEIYGDKYDTISGKFLEAYRPGAIHKNKTEREIVLKLGIELKKILDLTKTNQGFKKFQNIAKNYTNSKIHPVRFVTKLTRNDDFEHKNWKDGEDQNYKYRLYDFVDKKTGKKVLGRLSQINREKPYLVVSLHLNPSYPGHPGGMAAVIAPPYQIFQELRLISSGKMDESVFSGGPYRNWTKFVGDWNHLENAMTDAWIYFHGYWADQSGKNTNLNKFTGYRQNMVSWKYADVQGWENLAKRGARGQYAKSHDDYIARGKFWNRERGQGERLRRSNGYEGYGGDNLYAGNELLRFVHYGLSKRILMETGSIPELGPIHSPYISTYSLPTYLNAITAFLEIGYIDNERDMKYIEGYMKVVAESLAIGIYSLFMGTSPLHKEDFSYRPKGKKLGFEKYEKINGKNYFHIMAE